MPSAIYTTPGGPKLTALKPGPAQAILFTHNGLGEMREAKKEVPKMKCNKADNCDTYDNDLCNGYDRRNPCFEPIRSQETPPASPSNSTDLLECLRWHEEGAIECQKDMEMMHCDDEEDFGICDSLREMKAKHERFAAAIKVAL